MMTTATPVPLNEKRLLTPAEAAVYLATNETRIYRLVNTGKLRAVRDVHGRGMRIDRLDCDRLVDEASIVKPIEAART